jgi:hypothetical protein
LSIEEVSINKAEKGTDCSKIARLIESKKWAACTQDKWHHKCKDGVHPHPTPDIVPTGVFCHPMIPASHLLYFVNTEQAWWEGDCSGECGGLRGMEAHPVNSVS